MIEPDDIQQYLDEIQRTPLLTKAEEITTLAKAAQGDTEARDLLIRANLRFVVYMAKKYRFRGLSYCELIAEGNLGLIRAIELFDPKHKVRLQTYAAYWIDQTIKRAILNTGRTIRIPAYMQELIHKWHCLALSQGIDPETNKSNELAKLITIAKRRKKLGLNQHRIDQVRQAMRLIHQMSNRNDSNDNNNNDDSFFLNSIPDKEIDQSDDRINTMIMHMGKLSQRDQTILKLYFGLNKDNEHTLQEIGQQLGLTRERVRQIKFQALDKLKKAITKSDTPRQTVA